MKRTCSLLLAAILAGTLATPAAAAATPAADDRLTQVTQAVKETLGLGDDYTSFYGELQEDSYRALWSLTWETEQQSTLRVTAGEDGAIYLYTNSTDAASTPDNSAVSTFPALSRDQARAKAQAFLDQVLTAPESADLAADTGRSAASSDSHYFNTQLLLYGLPTPIGLSVTVDAETGLRFILARRLTQPISACKAHPNRPMPTARRRRCWPTPYRCGSSTSWIRTEKPLSCAICPSRATASMSMRRAARSPT